MFKKVLMGFVCIALVAMVGCGSSGSSSHSNPSYVYNVNIPLPQENSSMRASLRAVAKEDFTVTAYYAGQPNNTVAVTIATDSLKTTTAKCACIVPYNSNLVIKSKLYNKDYYQGIATVIDSGSTATLDADSTAKTMVFEKMRASVATLSVSQFENSVNDVWSLLGVEKDAVENVLKNTSSESDATALATLITDEKIEAAATKIEIVTPTPTPEPTPTPTPATITEQGYDEFEKYEETGALTWTPLNSLDAINRIEEGLAEVSESGQFIALNENIVLTLAAEATVQNNVRTWKVYPYENGARVAYRFIDSISTTPVTALEKQGYHAVYYYATPNEQGVYTQVGKDFSWFATETKAENFVSLDVKVTDGVADLQYTTDDGTSQSSGFTTTPLAKVNVWYANHQGSVYVKLENQTTKAARILQVASK